MSGARADQIKGIAGCGILCALIVSAFGGDDTMQWTFFAFGCTYGGLWIAHE